MVGAYVVGARSGFYVGYQVGQYTTEMTSAVLLIAHHGADETGPNRLLPETMIDSALLSAWQFHETYVDPPFYAPREAYVDLDTVLARLARYRQHNPSTHDDPEARSAILRIVAEHGSN